MACRAPFGSAMSCLTAVVAPCLPPPPPAVRSGRGSVLSKRLAVSAEAGNDDDQKAETVVKTYEKSVRAREQILQHTHGKTLFAGMTQAQREAVVDAMFEVKCQPNEVVIAQGDMGE